MKKLIKQIGSLVMALPFLLMIGSCQKFLDRKPLTATLDDLNQGGLEGQIFGLYSNLRGSAGFTTIPWLAMHDFRSDDSEKGSDPSDGAEWVAPFDRYNYVKDLWASNTYWDDHYTLINLANTAIQTADSLKLTDAASLSNIAEARFFRAFAYFDLVRSYGEIPKIDFRVYQASQANIAKSATTDIYNLIDADLQFATINLPVNWVVGNDNKYPGRLTSGAAKTLLAKAHIFRGNWAQCLGLCNQVMGSVYSLYPSYFGIFKDAGKNCSESIFEIQAYVSPNGAINNGCAFATTQGVRGSNASGWDLGWGWNTPTENLVSAYEAGDVRKNSTILFSGQSDDPATGGYGRVLPKSTFDLPEAGPLPRKYWNKKIYADPAYRASTGLSNNPAWINKRVLRYADVILMAAECNNELGNGPLAATQIKQVRDRVSMPAVAFVDKVQMRDAIKRERRVEFGVEGERFFDLVRWNDAVTVLGPLGYQNKCRYYPIPQPAIDKSAGKLIQNPEW